MEHVWSLLCTKGIIDQRTKMVSIIDTMDALDIGGDSLPPIDQENPTYIGPISMSIVSYWYRSDVEKPETGQTRLKFIGPNGKSYATKEQDIDLTKGHSNTLVAAVSTVPFVGFGMYYFEVEKKNQDETNWLKVARLPLQLRQDKIATVKTD